ncbi:Putative acetyltransferase [Salinivirga cyanobacteriivorans]|uniref:Acetyltransferase n=1 Tax=Salinivirga cyanobacteriivorans TaxID=1307839 RepID=A0A0S2I0Q7_9BACT|nr:DapH/DapD/GlmU-related protein [Salinivirga cyanobacteriivorans]ALO15765.1 Putative acetyltransferase [Salinivirga cyanobacteriivorans]
MKTGLGIYKKYRIARAFISLLRFELKKRLVGFDVANLYLQRVDKYALVMILKKNGAQIGENCDIETGLAFHNCRNYKNLAIGDNCHIGKQCFFDLKDKISIQNNVTISMRCSFLTHTDVGSSVLKKKYPKSLQPIVINSNCYLGASVTLLQGAWLEEKTFVAAGALCKGRISAGKRIGGIPAKEI